jgi:hypothetical protein
VLNATVIEPTEWATAVDFGRSITRSNSSLLSNLPHHTSLLCNFSHSVPSSRLQYLQRIGLYLPQTVKAVYTINPLVKEMSYIIAHQINVHGRFYQTPPPRVEPSMATDIPLRCVRNNIGEICSCAY